MKQLLVMILLAVVAGCAHAPRQVIVDETRGFRQCMKYALGPFGDFKPQSARMEAIKLCRESTSK